MFILKKMILIILVLTVNSFLFGTSIDWQLGARPQGMGSAFTALVDDVNACYWNAAGLPQVKKDETIGMYKFSDLGYNFNYFAHVHPLKNSAIGLSWSNVTGTLKQGREEEKSKMIDDVFSLGYGLKITDAFFLGLNVKRFSINSKIGGGAGLGLDLGFLFFPYENFSIGMVGKNISSDVKNEIAPCSYRIGTAIRFLENKLKCSLDVVTKSEVEDKKLNVFLNFGVEYQIIKIFALRAGMEKNNPCVGVGIQYNQYKIDYAYLSSKINEAPHVISLSIIWGGK
ncbi:MAG: PorV/PorQ family protein [bacterium]